MDIGRIDKNLRVETEIKREGLTFFDIKDEPFSIYGVFYENGEFVRMPDKAAAAVSDRVHILSKHTAGGRVRFITDSPYIAIKAVQKGSPNMSNMSPIGQAGLDLYRRDCGEEVYVKSFVPPFFSRDGFESVIDLPEAGEQVFTINFPLYFPVRELYVGIKAGSTLKAAPKYTVEKPVVFYGSSITQGGCASRAGTSYQGFLSRWYDMNYINLGFSGSAKGEESIARYIAGLDMSAFIYDYDHNTDSPQHLRETHGKFYSIIREAHPDIPIVFMTRPRHYLNKAETLQRDIIYNNYSEALARGERVYFVPGAELMALCANDGTVDGVHPTDFGFFSMASRLKVEFDKFISDLK